MTLENEFLTDPFTQSILEHKNIFTNPTETLINSAVYKIFRNNFLQKFWDEFHTTHCLFSIYIEENTFYNLDLSHIENNWKESILNILATSNCIKINNKIEIIQHERIQETKTAQVKQHLKELSHNSIVFFFGENGIDTIFHRENREEQNFFYTAADLNSFSQRKDISQIEEVLKNYQNTKLNKQLHYSYFFAEKSTLNQLNLPVSKYILKNKPEKYMRDHLTEFLNENMKHSFFIETELSSSKKELDIYTEVDGEFYFFEIKWLGVCIHKNGNTTSTTYTDSRAREGVTQTLEYIKELSEDMSQNIKFGFLVVFDAREQNKEIDYQDLNFIKDELKEYSSLLQIPPKLNLTNMHAG